MPNPGLSLVGFMDIGNAIQHLRNGCIPADPSDAALIQEWNAARGMLGPPIANAGHPEVLDIPQAHHRYVDDLLNNSHYAPQLQGVAVRLVEIEPLLAYQATVDDGRSAHHCGALPPAPPLGDLFPICLPQAQVNEAVSAVLNGNSAMLRSKSLNVRTMQAGVMNGQAMGLFFGVSLPHVHVVRFNGRCYLHNGFHRAVGLRAAGATHLPCLFRDVNDAASVGLNPPSTFDLQLLESTNPPTLGHFSQGRAYAVELRKLIRVLHVSWAEYAVPEDF
ncbi:MULTISPECIES: hypothetical protein [unclassified Mesorhizobium]|uniref:hypothetical protein n=1 Tax=unclassified Mesorhizobium TaxID=325217 RepID=UPI00112E89F7|nr:MULTISPECIES: hypothetical protein [unclassified Mesorhizobium]TPJ63492.1 hypothetical protein FJ443_10505 [Mesorhizobium sp. B2-6-1]TPM58908.1 hypothetical protein FJ959_08510 [Mesorhizobium sp. B2-2-4]TPM67392.1 hypothetical protein FJ965_09650 [Mesorhizobium sp. B2-2-1]TPN62461.1 hypothetical protein FJ984_25460 [Mesorhizobium sp. B1-1-3]